jgi:hypothetical protein
VHNLLWLNILLHSFQNSAKKTVAMPIWLIRAGSHGEYEQKFIRENRVYVTWDKLAVDLSKLHDRDALFMEMLKLYPAISPFIVKCRPRLQ